MRYGMTIPLEKVPLVAQREWVQETERLGFQDVWSSEATQFDGFTPLALASQWVSTQRLGCAAFPVQTRGPGLLAQSAATMTHAAPGRFVLGLCGSSEPIVSWWNARPFERPYYHVRDTIRFLRRAWTGELLTEDFGSFAVRYYKQRILPVEPPRILVAGLRQGMIELGAREADGVILNMMSPEDVAKVVPLVKAHGADKEVALRVTMCPTDDYARGMAVAKGWSVGYVTVSTYRAQQEWLGRGDMIAETNARWAKGDRKGAFEALPDEMVQTGWFVGTRAECRARLDAYAKAGLDTIILSYLEAVSDPWDVVRDLAPPAPGAA